VKYQFEYSNDLGMTWELVPDTVLPGNSSGLGVSAISVLIPDYQQIRVVANLSTSN